MPTSHAATVAAPANGHQRRRQETRRALLRAGRELFSQQSVKQVSIEAITAAAGVAKGSFYNHFESRDALYDEVLDQTVQQLVARYREFQPGIDDPLTLAVARTEFSFRNLLQDPGACRLLLQAGPSAPGGAIDRGLRAALGEELAEAAGLGAFSRLDPELVYSGYFGVVTSAIGHLLESPDSLDPAEGARQVARLCFAVLGLPWVDLEDTAYEH